VEKRLSTGHRIEVLPMLGCWSRGVAPGVFFPGAQPKPRSRLPLFRGENRVETALKASPTTHTLATLPRTPHR